MKHKHKVAGTESPIPSGLLKGALAAMGITLLGAAGMSALIIREILRETAIGYCAMAVIVCAAFASAMVAMKTVNQKLAVVAMLSAAVYFAILLGSNALLCRGEYEGIGVTALLILAGAGSALLMGAKPKKGGHSRLRKNRRR